jgi:hypothetical protein
MERETRRTCFSITTILFRMKRTSQFEAPCSLLVQWLATSWTVRGSNFSGDEIFRTRPDRPWVPPSLLYNGYRVSFPGVKRQVLTLWPVLGWTLPFPLPLTWSIYIEYKTSVLSEQTHSRKCISYNQFLCYVSVHRDSVPLKWQIFKVKIVPLCFYDRVWK